jgi:hypothetical protein
MRRKLIVAGVLLAIVYAVTVVEVKTSFLSRMFGKVPLLNKGVS